MSGPRLQSEAFPPSRRLNTKGHGHDFLFFGFHRKPTTNQQDDTACNWHRIVGYGERAFADEGFAKLSLPLLRLQLLARATEWGGKARCANIRLRSLSPRRTHIAG